VQYVTLEIKEQKNAKNRKIKMQPNFASPKRQKFNAATILCLTLHVYKPITLNSMYIQCTVSLF
jgi:hypothetical protein